MDEEWIDQLFMQADIDHEKDLARRLLIDNPRYASESDFPNAFYVIVHESQINDSLKAGVLDPIKGTKVKNQLAWLKQQHDYLQFEGWCQDVDYGLPRDRPILVCGVYLGVCVTEQYRELMKAGFNAYISKEGVMSLSDLL